MSKKKVNEDKNKKQGFLGRSRRFIKVGSFILIFCLIGIGGLLLTHAATSPSVRFVLFCAPDRCSGSVTTINNRALAVRSWYKGQLGGRTFRMLTTKKVTGHHTSDWYRTGTNIPAINTSDNIYKYESWLHEPNVKTVVILGFPSMDHCGSTPQWTDPSLDWLAVVDPYSQVIGGSDHYCPVQSPVYAHELGHTFNLQHVTESYNLMNGNIACSGSTLGNCHFNSSQKSYLLLYRSSWFPSVNSANSAGYDPDYVPYIEYPYLVDPTDSTIPPPPPSPPPPTNLGTTLQTNQRMYPNQMLVDNGYALIYQTDGNLVEYNPSNVAVWNSGTYGRSLGNLSMQGDGNLVLYNDYGGAMWFTGTNGKGDHNFFVVGGDGNMVVETNQSIPVWGLYNGGYIPEYAPNYWHPQPSSILYAHQILLPNQSLSTNGYRLTYQGDGNLVEYNSSNQWVWQSYTYGHCANNLKMQDDGNLVMYDCNGSSPWSSGTTGTGGANYFIVQPDSNLVVYTASGVPVWHRW